MTAKQIRIFLLYIPAVLLAVWTAPTTSAAGRDEIRIVGSSTVFPFSTAVAEEFGQVTEYRTPVVEKVPALAVDSNCFAPGLVSRIPISPIPRAVLKRQK